VEGSKINKNKQPEIVKTDSEEDEPNTILDVEEVLIQNKDSLNNYILKGKKSLKSEKPESYWGSALLEYKYPENEERKYKSIKYVRNENGIGLLYNRDWNTREYNEGKKSFDLIKENESPELELIGSK
jgi:hypothetical protein